MQRGTFCPGEEDLREINRSRILEAQKPQGGKPIQAQRRKAGGTLEKCLSNKNTEGVEKGQLEAKEAGSTRKIGKNRTEGMRAGKEPGWGEAEFLPEKNQKLKSVS